MSGSRLPDSGLPETPAAPRYRGTSWSRWGGDGAASPSPPPSGEIFDARLSHDVSSSRGPFPVSVDLFLVPGGVLQLEDGHSCPLQEPSVEVVAGGQPRHGRAVAGDTPVPSSAARQWRPRPRHGRAGASWGLVQSEPTCWLLRRARTGTERRRDHVPPGPSVSEGGEPAVWKRSRSEREWGGRREGAQPALGTGSCGLHTWSPPPHSRPCFQGPRPVCWADAPGRSPGRLGQPACDSRPCPRPAAHLGRPGVCE